MFYNFYRSIISNCFKKAFYFIVVVVHSSININAQCTTQITHTSGSVTNNCITTTVTSSGVVSTNNTYCTFTVPYFIGYNPNVPDGKGSYTFNFSPAVSAVTINFSGISQVAGSAEEVKVYVNGAHYAIPSVGVNNTCDPVALLTAMGNITGCSNCSVSGWNGTNISGPISTLTIVDSVLYGSPAGSLFSLFICATGSNISSTQNVSICTGNNFVLPGGNTVTSAGTYIDTLISLSGCDSIITTNLSVVTAISANQNATFCAGNSYTLPSGNSVSVAGTYIDTIASVSGCDSIITTNLNVVNAINTNQNPTICAGNSYTLPSGNNVSIAGIYKDTLTSQNGCDSIITTNLNVVAAINSNQNVSICPGGSYILPNGNSVSIAGIYKDTLTSQGGCDSIITITLSVNTAPASVSASANTIFAGESTTLTASGGNTFNWFPSLGLNNNTGNVVVATPLITTTYCVELTDNNGCKDTACITIEVKPPCTKADKLNLPNAFSPNNDGNNDLYCFPFINNGTQGAELCIENFEITIYNRWGEKVYECKNNNCCWDGKFNGNILDAQVLVYFLKVKYFNSNEIFESKGNISLLK